MKFFDLSHPIWQKIGKVGNLILLSLLWIVFSLPVITIGAATTALNKKIFDVFHDYDYHLICGFFDEFKVSFKKTIKIWIGCVVVAVIILFDLGFLFGAEGAVAAVGKIFFLVATGFFIAFLEIVFHISYREETEKEIVRKSLLTAVLKFPKLILAAVLQFVIFLFCVTDFIALLIFLPGILGWIGYFAGTEQVERKND